MQPKKCGGKECGKSFLAMNEEQGFCPHCSSDGDVIMGNLTLERNIQERRGTAEESVGKERGVL